MYRYETYNGVHWRVPEVRECFLEEMLANIKMIYVVRLPGNYDGYRLLSHRTSSSEERQRYVSSNSEEVEGLPNANNLRPTYRSLWKLHSKPVSWVSAIVKQMPTFYQAWMGRGLDGPSPLSSCARRTLQACNSKLTACKRWKLIHPTDENQSSPDETGAMVWLTNGKVSDVYKTAEMFEAGGGAVVHGLHAIVAAVWLSGIIPHYWKRGLLVLFLRKGKGAVKIAMTTTVLGSSACQTRSIFCS